MKLRSLEAESYRSLQSIRMEVGDINLFVGDNGAGKSNLYRALFLVHAAALGTFAHEIAAEGGMASVLWTGRRRRGQPVRVKLSVEMSDPVSALDWRYTIEAGLKPPAAAGFPFEPQIKTETLVLDQGRRKVVVLKRDGPTLSWRDEHGRMDEDTMRLLPSETGLARVGAGGLNPEVAAVRDALAQWRFYHGFRTDRDSPLRAPCLAVTAPMLAMDGGDLAAVFATLHHIRGDTVDLDRAVEEAFAGARLSVPLPDIHASFGMVFPQFPQRTFQASELSDGQLRFLALAGALLAYRLPRFIALNEPEASLHPAMLPALASMIARASGQTQIWVVTHSPDLAGHITERCGVRAKRVLRNDEGATWIDGLSRTGLMIDDADADGGV
ncbi:AAA family ATPase [Pararhizobium haloflavum]|uniref:AAA family ATPase n=1 Tax=Pararhizobium haloflavum TaxID=2037914 RepID=UPI000C199B3F|nr:AAA family ATPase [Pararhizobium haloflavum]